MRIFLRGLSKEVPDDVLTGLLNYVDTDGDGKSLTYEEFSNMLATDYLA